jgi:LicD family
MVRACVIVSHVLIPIRDWDVDMQIDVTTLQTLAEEYNQTTWTAIPSNAGPDGKPRDYMLDVNPFWVERVHGDGANFIDARFIDTRNGLYVDVTALTELNPGTEPNVVSCKNFHNYLLDDLYPLRETIFEGTKAKIPFNYKTILADEYSQRSLVQANYNGYLHPPIWGNLTYLDMYGTGTYQNGFPPPNTTNPID